MEKKELREAYRNIEMWKMTLSPDAEETKEEVDTQIFSAELSLAGKNKPHRSHKYCIPMDTAARGCYNRSIQNPGGARQQSGVDGTVKDRGRIRDIEWASAETRQ